MYFIQRRADWTETENKKEMDRILEVMKNLSEAIKDIQERSDEPEFDAAGELETTMSLADCTFSQLNQTRDSILRDRTYETTMSLVSRLYRV